MMDRHLPYSSWAGLALSLMLFVGLLLPRVAVAGGLDLERPGQRQFVADHADILDDAAEQEIKRIAARLLDEHATSLVVVTVESMAAHGGERMDIETFSRILFDQWGVGHPTLEQQDWDTGILIVVSEADRKARIELGRGWAHDKDAEARRIMDTYMLPAFREGDYSRGVVDAAAALDRMARTKPLPEPSSPIWDLLAAYMWIALAAVLVLAILVSLFKSGTSGWGWKLLALIFGLLLASALDRLRPGRCSGRRGSFGGGQSGGGGASGSW